MNCYRCNSELIWGGDFTFEDYHCEGDGIVTNLSCSSCGAYVEVYLPDEWEATVEIPDNTR